MKSLLLATTTAAASAAMTAPPPTCVVGAGPAGLQLSAFLREVGVPHVLLEGAKEGPGAFFRAYPRHRKLISINKRFTGVDDEDHRLRHDWNSLLNTSSLVHPAFTTYSNEMFPPAEAYTKYLASYAAQLGDLVKYDSRVVNIRKEHPHAGEGLFNLTLAHSTPSTHTTTMSCSRVVLATGISTPVDLVEMEGFREHVEQYRDIPIHGKAFENQRVLILGNGNSAHETSQALAGWATHVHIVSRNPIRLAAFTHYPGDVRAVNDELLDTYQLKSLDFMTEISDFERHYRFVNCSEVDDAGVHQDPYREKRVVYGKGSLTCLLPKSVRVEDAATDPWFGEARDHFNQRAPYERVIAALGFRFDTSIFSPDTKPIMKQGKGALRYLAVTCAYESVNIKNLFVTGTLSHARDYKRTAGGFVHGFRYQALVLARILKRGLSPGPSRGSPQKSQETESNLSASDFPPPNPSTWPLSGESVLDTSQALDPLIDAIMKRIVHSSALYQLHGELTDVVVLSPPSPPAGGEQAAFSPTVRYLRDVPRCACQGPPLDMLQRDNWQTNTFAEFPDCGSASGPMWNGEARAFALCDDRWDRILIYFRYHEDFHGSKVIERGRVGATLPNLAHMSTFLHPVIEFLPRAGSLAHPASLHLVEDVQVRWSSDTFHVDPLKKFLRTVLGRTQDSPYVRKVKAGLVSGMRVRMRQRYLDLMKGEVVMYAGVADPLLTRAHVRVVVDAMVTRDRVVWFEDLELMEDHAQQYEDMVLQFQATVEAPYERGELRAVRLRYALDDDTQKRGGMWPGGTRVATTKRVRRVLRDCKGGRTTTCEGVGSHTVASATSGGGGGGGGGGGDGGGDVTPGGFPTMQAKGSLGEVKGVFPCSQPRDTTWMCGVFVSFGGGEEVWVGAGDVEVEVVG